MPNRQKLLPAAVLLALAAITAGSMFFIAPVWQPGYHPVAYLPAMPEEPEAGAEETKINLNTATVEELTALPGIGDAKAAAIIAYRGEHGAFAAVEDAAKVGGVSEEMVQSWAGLAVVE